MRRTAAAFLFAALAASSAPAATAVPSADETGADLPWLKRYEGSVIVDFRQKEFDEVDFVAGVLKPQEGYDEFNNARRVPEAIVTQQGRLTRFVYVLPEGRGPLEATAGYGQELAGLGGETLFQCKEDGCGGAPGNAVDSGGNTQGLINYVFKRDWLPEKPYTPGWCVLTARNVGQRYVLTKADSGAGTVHVSVFAAQISADGGDCKAFDKRTIAIVTVLEDKPREQRMETVSAEKMGEDIMAEGRTVLYGVYFDTDKATIKSESKPQMDEIAAYLKANPDSKYLVVGHTDNQGEVDYNQGLSQRRAAAVTAALTKEYGIPKAQLTPLGVGMAAPIASNADEAGRAKNRRVEIVAR